ncbi:bZIP transcription factor [Aspergillus thermomutatus]|uniref:BZIP domain-containing protein n=1 Tax=Aspergillus thermomutatus TaxID=41047 RepID=A0A397HTE5_ASPTH|nr:uncharacterized protein CDV56_104454 [Aspergillus thermomutatus]RHZ64564.1 hypothetical protein CDV56_104454 [Aspergillus thermomutatus]
MSSNQDTTQSATKKRESRAGTRKVTTLSAEQLARKRANDREAQRTIRQRTKEHIERLQNQVAELQAKNQQFDDVMRRNAALEHEIKALRQQLGMLTGDQGYSSVEGSYSSPAGAPPPTHYSESLNVPPVSRAPSVLSASSQVSVAQEWQTYGSTRSSSLCESSDADYSNRAEPYGFEAQAQPSHTMSNTIPHANFNTSNVAHPPDPTFQQYPHKPCHMYPADRPCQCRKFHQNEQPGGIQYFKARSTTLMPLISQEEISQEEITATATAGHISLELTYRELLAFSIRYPNIHGKIHHWSERGARDSLLPLKKTRRMSIELATSLRSERLAHMLGGLGVSSSVDGEATPLAGNLHRQCSLSVDEACTSVKWCRGINCDGLLRANSSRFPPLFAPEPTTTL